MIENLSANAGDIREMQVRSPGRKDPLEKGMATHSSILAWRIPWTGSLVGYSPQGCEESDLTEMHENVHTHAEASLASSGSLWTCLCGFFDLPDPPKPQRAAWQSQDRDPHLAACSLCPSRQKGSSPKVEAQSNYLLSIYYVRDTLLKCESSTVDKMNTVSAFKKLILVGRKG